MLSDEEKQKKLEQEYQYALDNIVSKIKGETATAIVYSEQYMILLFRKLMFKIEKQSKEIEEMKNQLDLDYVYNNFISKAKIKAKIEVLEKLQKEFPNSDEIRIKIIAYKELLEKE